MIKFYEQTKPSQLLTIEFHQDKEQNLYYKTQKKVRLFSEGERLFTTYGLKKVTIDDMVSAVNIAKATFYTFYDNKELLYLDIVQNVQFKIFTELDTLLYTNTDLDAAFVLVKHGITFTCSPEVFYKAGNSLTILQLVLNQLDKIISAIWGISSSNRSLAALIRSSLFMGGGRITESLLRYSCKAEPNKDYFPVPFPPSAQST